MGSINSNTQPDWNAVNRAVGIALSTVDQNTVPIDIFKQCEALGIQYYSYEEFAKISGYSIDIIIKTITASVDGALLFLDGDPYILYNDDTYYDGQFIPEQRIRFTIAHELGHYCLHHFDDDDTILTHRRIPKEKYLRFELEAELFAADFLIPPILIPDEFMPDSFFLSQGLNIPTRRISFNDQVRFIQDTFDVSRKAAFKSLERFRSFPRLHTKWHHMLKVSNELTYLPMNHLDTYRPIYGPEKVVNNIQILFHKNYIVCPRCNAVCWNFNSDAKFCPVCRSEAIYFSHYNLEFREKEGRKMIEYYKYPVSGANSHIKTDSPCPRCGSEISTDPICSVCGLILENRCTGISIEELSDEINPFTNESIEKSNINMSLKDFHEPISTKQLFACAKENDHQAQSGKARFCSKCGSVTTFYIQSMFQYWKDEREKIISKKSFK